jgi:hypothetical protein
MWTAERGALRSDWFNIAPRIQRGERSLELLEQIADVLRPKPKVGKRLNWYDEEVRRDPERPSDLMSIDYEIEDAITDEAFLSVWPENAPVDVDDKLLTLLTNALTVAVQPSWNGSVATEYRTPTFRPLRGTNRVLTGLVSIL